MNIQRKKSFKILKQLKNPWVISSCLILSILLIQACQPIEMRQNYKDVNTLMHEAKNMSVSPYLKAHLKNGDVLIFDGPWSVDTVQVMVKGEAMCYDFNRKFLGRNEVSVNIDKVAIFETNSIDRPEKGRITALSILAGLDVALGIVCVTNPKACFGSCPTFYVNENDNFHFADAEGFSNAISPSMEYFDIDAIQKHKISGKEFSLTMKNEALETHCVNNVKLLAYPTERNERVYQAPNNQFYLSDKVYELKKAESSEGDITDLIASEDRKERFSLADEKNLSSKEEIYLSFEKDADDEDLGLFLNFRQTLMTTYFIYSAMGYMGDEVGDIFAKLERDGQAHKMLKGGLKKELGNLDVYVWDENESIWVLQDGFYETGPIAPNRQVLPLSTNCSGKEVKVKLVLNKGLWRIDQVALARLNKEVKPFELNPSFVSSEGKENNQAKLDVLNPERHLISMPGNQFEFTFEMPEENQEYELFLYSKGYYLEWMRSQWLAEKNLLKLRQMLENPKRYLKAEAKAYKEYEQTMEHEFWNSKVETKTYSYYE